VHVVRPNYTAITRLVRWAVLVLAVLLAMTVVLVTVMTAPARADTGAGPGQGPDQTGPDQAQAEAALQAAIENGTADGTYVGPFGHERWVGVFGTHTAAGYGYPYPAARDCNEGTLGVDCVGDSRGFIQGQCTSWVAYRLAMRNGLSFSNWYAGMHWGNASEWKRVAKAIGHKPDKYPAVGAIGWYKRGHVSYVESVYSNGTIVISEMNTDGHNGFHFATVSPGMSSYPDKFIHLDDVVPVDTTPPTEPTGVRAAAHRGRTTVAWRASSDAFGVAGYRVLRNGMPLATVRGTSYRDANPPVGQTAVYSVVAFDAAGHVSRPGRVKVLPGAEAVDRAWVETSAGPAFCGRTGHARKPRLGCRILVDGGWRNVPLTRKAAWGEPASRAFLPAVGGGVAYCRAIGRAARSLSCIELDADGRAWGPERSSGKTPRLAADATWVSTPDGPARCGLSGAARRPGVTCSVLTFAGWRTSTQNGVPWGSEDGRAFLTTTDGAIAFCRWLTAGRGARTACIDLNPLTLTWGADRRSGRLMAGAPSYPTWVGSSAGPASCWSPSADRRGACRVLLPTGWRTASLPRSTRPGTAGTRSFLVDRAGQVSWCRMLGRSAACTELSGNGTHWRPGRTVRALRSMQADNRTWVSLAAGPALCGRTGTVRQQRLACQVLTEAGWRTAASQVASWGSPGYRSFVPSGSGVAYCRTVAARKHGSALSCTPMSKRGWGATRTSQRVPLVLPDLV
jgi:hypothetical protein